MIELNKEFVNYVQQLEKLLINIRLQCSSFENEVDKRKRVDIVKNFGKQYYDRLNDFFLKLSLISMAFNKKQYLAHKHFIRECLYLLMADPGTKVNKQIGEKPLGYAGDYLVAKYFYENGYTGDTLYAMFMDRYTVESLLACAHRNRRSVLGKILKDAISKNCQETYKIASFACGPAPEVFDLIAETKKSITFNLFDGEPEVIKLIKECSNLTSHPTQEVLVDQVNILHLLRRKNDYVVKNQDVVYCAGFFDYIKPLTATKFIRYMLGCLKSDGLLIVVNVSEHDQHNVYLKMLGEWDLHHRTKEEVLGLVGTDFPGVDAKVWADADTERNYYLALRKL